MALVKAVVIELKTFEVAREGRWLILTERGWKFVRNMRMELATARWFSKALEDGRRKGFYASHREGDRDSLCRGVQIFKVRSWRWKSVEGAGVVIVSLFLKTEKGGDGGNWQRC